MISNKVSIDIDQINLNSSGQIVSKSKSKMNNMGKQPGQ